MGQVIEACALAHQRCGDLETAFGLFRGLSFIARWRWLLTGRILPKDVQPPESARRG